MLFAIPYLGLNFANLLAIPMHSLLLLCCGGDANAYSSFCSFDTFELLFLTPFVAFPVRLVLSGSTSGFHKGYSTILQPFWLWDTVSLRNKEYLNMSLRFLTFQV